MYKELIRMCDNKEVDFSKATTVNLDEYIGLSGRCIIKAIDIL